MPTPSTPSAAASPLSAAPQQPLLSDAPTAAPSDAGVDAPENCDRWTPLERSAFTPEGVRSVARMIYDRVNPRDPSVWQNVLERPLPHVYAPTICAPALFRLKASLANGSPLYLLGECEGVGVSFLLADVATAFNLGCERAGDPRRVLHVPLLPGCTSVRHFFDAVATLLQADFTISELKTRSSTWLGERLYALLCQARIAMISVDHVHLLPAAVREVLTALLQITNPNYRPYFDGGSVPLNPARVLGTGPGFDDDGSGSTEGPRGPGARRPNRRPPPPVGRPRIGVVFASHEAPETVFRRDPGALLLLRGARVRYPRYTTAEQVGEALRQADIGLQDFGRRPEDALIAEFVLEQSEGLVAVMDPLLALVDGLARHNAVAGGRPTLALFQQALKGHAKMVRVIEERANVPGGRRLRVVANGVALGGRAGARLARGSGGADADREGGGQDRCGDVPGDVPEPGPGPARATERPTKGPRTAAQRLAIKRLNQAKGRVQKQAMGRKRHPALADVPGGRGTTGGGA